MLQITSSIENVLQDIKAKHDSAEGQLAAAGAGASKAQDDISLLKAAQQNELDEIKKLCKCAYPNSPYVNKPTSCNQKSLSCSVLSEHCMA